MLATPFLIGVFVLAFRWFARRSVWTTAAAIPCIIVSGLLAMNFFEPAAQAFGRSSGPFSFLGSEADFGLFMGLFSGALLVFNLILKSFPEPPALAESIEIPSRLSLTVIASYILMAITLTACDTSPRLQSVLDLRPDSAALLGVISPDSQWLSFVEFIAESSFSRQNRSSLQPKDQIDQRSLKGHEIQTFRRRYSRIRLGDVQTKAQEALNSVSETSIRPTVRPARLIRTCDERICCYSLTKRMPPQYPNS